MYSHRFFGKGKDGSTGFKVPDKKDLDAYISTVENFGNNVFKVGSSSDSSHRSVVFFLRRHNSIMLWWYKRACVGGHYFPIFPPLSDSNYLDRGRRGEGAVFLGSSPLEQKYINHGDITCITYEIIPAVHPYAAF